MSMITPNAEMLRMLAAIPDSQKIIGERSIKTSGRCFDPDSSIRAMFDCYAEGGDAGFYIKGHPEFFGLNLKVRALRPKLSGGYYWARGLYERDCGDMWLAGLDFDPGLIPKSKYNTDDGNFDQSKAGTVPIYPTAKCFGFGWTLAGAGETVLDFKRSHLRLKKFKVRAPFKEWAKFWREGVYVFSGGEIDMRGIDWSDVALCRFRGSDDRPDEAAHVKFHDTVVYTPNGSLLRSDRESDHNDFIMASDWDSGDRSTISFLADTNPLLGDFDHPFFFDADEAIPDPVPDPVPDPDPVPVPDPDPAPVPDADLDEIRNHLATNTSRLDQMALALEEIRSRQNMDYDHLTQNIGKANTRIDGMTATTQLNRPI